MSEEHRKKYFPLEASKAFSFYDSKDGENCLQKTVKLSGYTGAIGTTFALMSGLTSTTADNPALASNVLIRLTKYGLPMFAAGGMFAATTCTVANLRGGKDDPFNHFAGGLATGSVFGTAFKSQKLGWGLGFAFAFLAMIWKAGKIEGFTNINPSEYRREKTLGAHNRSYLTTRPNPEGNPNL